MSNYSKNKRVFLLLLLFLGLIAINLGNNFTFLDLNKNLYDDNEILRDPVDFNKLLLKSAEPQDFSGNGEQLNVTLHQSLVNLTEITFLNLDNKNNFNEAYPKFNGYQSSLINITIDNIYAPNKSFIIEDDYTGLDFLTVNNHYVSFETRGSGFLENLSLYIKRTNIDTGTCDMSIYLYNATQVSGQIRPNSLVHATPIVDDVAVTGTTYYWFNATNLHSSFNSEQTYNNTFFLRVQQSGGTESIIWNGAWDTASPDNNDESLVYESDKQTLETVLGSTIDLTLKVSFSPLNHVPLPSEIGLKINNTDVNDISQGKGYWSPTQTFSTTQNKINFVLNPEWWDVSCKVTYVQINYTKSDLLANSEFDIFNSGGTVQWNVSVTGGLNYFDSRIPDFNTINFTIPKTWLSNSIQVFNDTTEWLSTDINKDFIKSAYRYVQILNTGNGSNWYLLANSTNLLSSIDTYILGVPSITANFSDIIRFNATFSEIINAGSLNLSIFSPISRHLNHSNIIYMDPSNASTEFLVYDWDISNNAIDYGSFLSQMRWSNETAAGFLSLDFTVLADTELIPYLPKPVFNSGESFNITVFFHDIGQDLGISGADISYSIEGLPDRTDNIVDLGNGNYTIEIDCNDTQFGGYGPKMITIKVNKHYYNNQTIQTYFTILGETGLTGFVPKSSFNSTETFDIYIFFNDTVKDIGTDGATIDVYVNQTTYIGAVITPYGGGDYNITIDCDADIFDIQGYGSFNISLDIHKTYYHNQSISFIIYITGETELIGSKFPDPIKGYYNSDETFIFTALFNDIGRNEGIDGGSVNVYVKETSAVIYQLYSTTITPYGTGYYNITIDCSDSIFASYGKFDIKVNISKQHYYTAEYVLEELVIGNTTLTILAPSLNINYVEDENFDIMIEYLDHTLSTGITGAYVSYTLNGIGYRDDKVVDNVDGTYNITINAGDIDFGSNYGYRDIIIRINQTNYVNLTKTFTFERQITTKILPSNISPLFELIRGNNATYTFNYTDKNDSPIVTYDNFQSISSLHSFNWYLRNDGGGFYTLDLDSTNAIVNATPYSLKFEISAYGNESQEITINVLVKIISTKIQIESWNENSDFARSTDINVSINLYFNDTTNSNPITGLNPFTDIIIRDYDTGTIWSPGFMLYEFGGGYYKLNISTIDMVSGFYTLQLNISKFPNYNWSLEYVQFYLRGNYTQIMIESISDINGDGILNPIGLNYTAYIERDLYINFTIIDLEFFNNLVIGSATSYTVHYYDLNNLLNNGILVNTLSFDANTNSYKGYIITSAILTLSNYMINITIEKSNYENATYSFNLIFKPKHDVRINIISKPIEVIAGNTFNLTLQAEYLNNSIWYPLIGSNIRITPYFDGTASTAVQTIMTNSSGGVLFEITIRSDALNLTLLVELEGRYFHKSYSLQISDIIVIPLSPGLTLEDLIPYIIIGAIILIGITGSVAAYKGVIAPRKRKKARILSEVKTVFDDAINLEHILVLYKETGTCIFFKSYGSEQIDPELIGGFLTAVSSFGKEMVAQEALNEISYGDKMLLLADGPYIRVALVLSKKASLILRRNLKLYIDEFEKIYKDVLPNWRGQLVYFRNAGQIVDKYLNTSIILPHQISYDFSSVKELKSPNSREVLKMAHSCCEEAERQFFFIATLLKEASEKTTKDTAEIFMGVKELRDKKMLIPIEISRLEAQPVSQQEINLINQRVSQLTTLSPEERQNLVNDLSQMGPAEREAYLSSIIEKHKIVSAPIKSMVGTFEIVDKKQAKNGVKELFDRGNKAKSKKNYQKAIELYRDAAMIASNWELSKEFIKLEELIRKTRIVELTSKKKDLENEAKLSIKKKNYLEAAQKYKYASKIASEIFKLGVTNMTKEVKRLTNKANEYEKLK